MIHVRYICTALGIQKLYTVARNMKCVLKGQGSKTYKVWGTILALSVLHCIFIRNSCIQNLLTKHEMTPPFLPSQPTLKTHELQSVHGSTNVSYTALYQVLQYLIGRNTERDTRVAPFGSTLGALGRCNLLQCLEHVGMGYRIKTARAHTNET